MFFEITECFKLNHQLRECVVHARFGTYQRAGKPASNMAAANNVCLVALSAVVMRSRILLRKAAPSLFDQLFRYSIASHKGSFSGRPKEKRS